MLCQLVLPLCYLLLCMSSAAAVAADPPALPASGQKPATNRDDTKYWKDALLPIQDQPGLPRVLMIGDSVSVGYTIFTRELLKGEANVHRIPANGGHTRQALPKIDGWLGTSHW